MGKARRVIGMAFALLLAGSVSYCSYGFLSAESRVKGLCAEIRPGMPLSELKAFSARHGLRAPTKPSGINYLVESRSFGRYGCEVLLESGSVRTSRYLFTD